MYSATAAAVAAAGVGAAAATGAAAVEVSAACPGVLAPEGEATATAGDVGVTATLIVPEGGAPCCHWPRGRQTSHKAKRRITTQNATPQLKSIFLEKSFRSRGEEYIIRDIKIYVEKLIQ
jgi:hypothetical protein